MLKHKTIPLFYIQSRVYRNYGAWVARNPILVLCTSLSIVLILCVGLVRFKVETRPEKVSYFSWKLLDDVEISNFGFFTKFICLNLWGKKAISCPSSLLYFIMVVSTNPVYSRMVVVVYS